jgi:hypothetical protein
MAGYPLIDAYLGELAGRLPSDAVDELADGLHETWCHHLDQGLTPSAAARAAIAEFGTPHQITGAFVAHATGRRTARTLLVTGPLFGVCWGTSLIAAKAWAWPIPAIAGAAFAVSLLAVVGCLVAAATSQHNYRRTRLGNLGAAGLIALDAAMITAVTFAAPTLVWPMAIAIPASLIRIATTLHRIPSPITS